MSEQRIKSTNQVRILTKVQYGRAVAQVRLGFWPFYKHADQKMLQASLAEVYRGGVVLSTYGDKKGLQAYSAMETKAQGKKECMFCGPKRWQTRFTRLLLSAVFNFMMVRGNSKMK